ncbi:MULTISPECIES: heme exporter protein CcmD [unclassified Luteimonas]
MSYREYVIAAYAVFALMLAWDFIAPRLAIARQLRAARRLAARKAARPTRPDRSTELGR